MTSRAGQPSGPGIVLAGGASRRLGAAGRKEWIRLGGRTLLERVVDAVAAETSRVLVVTAPDRLLPPLSRPVDIVHDSAPGQGPLAALLDGMHALGDGALGRPVVVASCDLPFLKRDVVRILLDRAAASHADWTVPEIGGHPQMLCSVLRASLTGTIAAWIARGRRDLRGLLDALRAEGAARVCMVDEGAFSAVDPKLESFRDVDTAADCDAIGGQLPYGDRPGAAYTPPS